MRSVDTDRRPNADRDAPGSSRNRQDTAASHAATNRKRVDTTPHLIRKGETTVSLQIRGCQKPNPEYLYCQESGELQDDLAPEVGRCGDLVSPAQHAPTWIRLCRDCHVRCVVSPGLIW